MKVHKWKREKLAELSLLVKNNVNLPDQRTSEWTDQLRFVRRLHAPVQQLHPADVSEEWMFLQQKKGAKFQVVSIYTQS